MCQSIKDGGKRCPSHTLQFAERKFKANPSEENHKKRDEARRVYDATPKGRRLLVGVVGEIAQELHKAQLELNKKRRQVAEHPAEQQVEQTPETVTVSEEEAEEENPFTATYDSPAERLEAFTNELQNRIDTLGEDDNYTNYLNMLSTFHNYSMSNQILIGIQNPEATQVAGFKAWVTLGRTVNKGEKSIKILAPSHVLLSQKDKDGKPVLDDAGKPVKHKQLTGFRVASVFDISQTSGEDLPTFGKLTETPPPGYKEDLEKVITAEGFTVSYKPITGGAEGYTAKKTKQVVIDSRLSPSQQASVLAHELGHIKAGHLDRNDYHTGLGGCRGDMEVEAETIAYVLSRANGMSRQLSDSSAAYISSWSKKNPEHFKKSVSSTNGIIKDLLNQKLFRNARTSE